MLILLGIIIWLTVSGANVASKCNRHRAIWHRRLGTRTFQSNWNAVVDHGLHLGWRVSRPGMGRQRNAPADDDLLPRLHFSGRPRLSAARGLQPGLDVQENRRTRQTIVDNGNGIWM